MDYTVLENSALFSGIPTKELCNDLNTVPHHIQRYDKGETIFHLMDDGERKQNRYCSGRKRTGAKAIPERKSDQCFCTKGR